MSFSRALLCSIIALFGIACGQSQPVIDARAKAPVDDATPRTDSPSSITFEEVAARYGTLSTVAGAGTNGTKGENGWLPSFEGGPATDAELSRPHITVSDDAGNLYVADKDAHAIRMVSPDGVITTVAGTGEPGDGGDAPGPAIERRLSSPNGLWARADGTLYILDLGNDKVRVRSPSGELSTLFAIGGAGTGRGLWVSDDESLAYVAAGSALKKWTPEAGVSVLASGFVSLGNLVVAPDGAVIVCDRLGHRVYRVTADGTRTAIAGNGTPTGGGDGFPALETAFDEVRGVWLYPEGGYFLATHKGGQIWYVDPRNIAHLFVDGDTDDTHAGDGEHFQTPGPKISEPRAVTMDASGDLIITENDAGYVRRVARIP